MGIKLIRIYLILNVCVKFVDFFLHKWDNYLYVYFIYYLLLILYYISLNILGEFPFI